jgi:hypothetical protein
MSLGSNTLAAVAAARCPAYTKSSAPDWQLLKDSVAMDYVAAFPLDGVINSFAALNRPLRRILARR